MEDKLIAELLESLDKNDSLPLYQQIERGLSDMMRCARLLPGDKIPGDQELASLLNVGHMTVRRALSELEAKGLVRRVRKAGTFVSDGLRAPMSTIGFFYPIESQSYRAKAAEHMQVHLAAHGYDLKIVPFGRDYYERVNLYNETQMRGLSAAIVVAMPSEECVTNILRLEEKGFPYIRYGNDNFHGLFRGTLVKGNEILATHDALQYARGLGHSKIGLISEGESREVVALYRSVVSRTDGYRSDWVVPIHFTEAIDTWHEFSGGQSVTRRYLESNPELTAVLVGNAAVTLDLIEQASLMGKRVPQDLTIICLRDWGGLMATSPKVTSMFLSPERVAEVCVKEIMDTIENGIPKDEKTIRITYSLIERESAADITRSTENSSVEAL